MIFVNKNRSFFLTFKGNIDINIQDSYGDNVLMQKIESTDLVHRLLDMFKDKIDINKKNNDGHTVLMLAIQYNIDLI